MKFKTRIRVTFISIIVLPLVLTSLAFCGIGLYLVNVQRGFSVESAGYKSPTANINEIVAATDKAYEVLMEQVRLDPARLENKEYLEEVNSEIARSSTYILVRRGNELYYAGN